MLEKQQWDEIQQFKMQSHTLWADKEFCNGWGHDLAGEGGRHSDCSQENYESKLRLYCIREDIFIGED